MKKIKFKNIFVLLFSALFLSTVNLTYSFSSISCQTEECCETDCCEENESTENSINDLTLCDDYSCCEYNQSFENDIKNSTPLPSSQYNYMSGTTKIPYYNQNSINKFNLQQFTSKQYPVHLPISILRI